MRKSAIQPMPELYGRYIDLVEDLTLNVALDKHFANIQNLNLESLEELGNLTYKPGKWTVKEVLQHLIDWERVFVYRAVVFARKEGTIPSGHDENIMATNSKANSKSVNEIIEDFIVVRSCTSSLFRGYDEEDLMTVGQNWNMEMSVLSVGFTIVGHQIHHFNMIQERYLPLLGIDATLIK
ncbi:DinB family protein [Moheibacter sediminis]|uniref:DinB superfamily protein n=1 Tax=Moheibacter sediminis TaxID=1434700 RepID=A0A1W2C4L6_9FLAO|nr:DinB family protein [Moheibacter sediminis]SMC79954.1 DinB superfamily protein [Moheibacter sediminis]